MSLVISLDDACAHVMSQCAPLPVVPMPARHSLGYVLAADVVAVDDVPPFVNSAVDGYAVRADSLEGASVDNPVVLPVVGEVAAGAWLDRAVGVGEAVRIMTGAPVPAGADTIVMVEDTERLDGGSSVRIMASPERGSAVRPVGDDVHAGTLLYRTGTVVTPAVAAVLATVNASVVSVYRRPRVAVLSTGDELVEHDGPLAPGQIRESNRTMLLGLVGDAGVEAVDYGTVVDDEAALEAVLRAAANECDAIVTSGGVSMGDYDVVKAVLSRIADMRWMQIAIKPAKPFAFGLLDVSADDNGAAGNSGIAGSGAAGTSGAGGVSSGTNSRRRVPVFGLPGNPVSSLVSFELLARPALRQMAGRADVQRPTVQAIADHGLPRRADGKVHFVRVVGEFGADGRLHVQSVGAQASHQLAATSMATGMAVVPDGSGVPVGGEVRTTLFWNQ